MPTGIHDVTVSVPTYGNRRVTIIYPATSDGNNTPMTAGTKPMLLLGHGQIGNGSYSSTGEGIGFAGSTWLHRSLVSLGYVLVGPHYTDVVGQMTEGTAVTKFFLDYTLSTWANGAQVDPDQIGFAGTSMGGMIGYALMNSSASLNEPRIKAYFFRATSRSGSTSGTLLSGPALAHAHGTADSTVSFASGQSAYNAAAQPKAFITLTGKGHDLLETGPYYTNDANPAASGLAGFFGYFLLGNSNGLDVFRTAMTASGSDVTLAEDWGAAPPAGPPVITSFTPTSGTEGSTVQINGTDFTGTTAVRFNGTSASFSEVSGVRVDGVVPNGATDGPITVVTPLGSDDSFTSFDVTAVTPGSGPHNPAIAGVWALHEFATGSTLTVGSSVYNDIQTALSFSGVIGFCARVHVDQLSPTNGSLVSTLLDQCRVATNASGKKLAVRLIGGRYTPAYVFDTLGARSYSVSGGNGRAPDACHTDGTPNVEYIDWLETVAADVKTWMLAQGAGKCPLLHWTWFSNQYSEFYHGTEVRSPNTGYDTSQLNFIAASNDIIDRAYALSDSNIACSFGMSGTHVEDVQIGVINHMTSIAGDYSPRLYFTANGVSDTGVWGATTEATQNANTGLNPYGPAGRRVSHGGQMIQPGNYSNAYWTAVCDILIANKSDLWEVYLADGSAVGAPGQSFEGANAADLQTQINRFVATLTPEVPASVGVPGLVGMAAVL